MADNNSGFNFNISLSVLDHLGRNLYRSFITVIGEAISNSWDANAKNVWITINKDDNYFVIKDDGIGMSEDDFQNRFLNIGYSKRDEVGTTSPNPENRPFIGRKGIGKLALLSCAQRISIITKTLNTDYVGGTIDNNRLDDEIDKGVTAQDFKLGVIEDNDIFISLKQQHEKGTIIFFENLNEGIKNKLEYIKILIALYFRFSLIDPNFNIFVNDEKITVNQLQKLADKTQFLWNINSIDDPYLDLLQNLKNSANCIPALEIDGFIASVEKPSGLKIRTSDEKAGIDLFVNGRLRERDVLKHMPDFATRHIASYLYGQIHFNTLDGAKDRMTTSREGVKEDDEEYKKLVKELQNNILVDIQTQWNEWRKELKIIKPNIKDLSIPNFDKFVSLKQKAINNFLSSDEGEDLKDKAKEMIAKISPSEGSDKKILITHSSKDKKQADIIYQLLIFCGFDLKEILYTSSDNINSKTPEGVNTLDYIKQFFVNDWFERPYVFFIASQNMESSWYACLEVGAFWIIENKHKIATVEPYKPQLPLNPDNHIYLVFDNTNQCDKEYLFEMFKGISKDFGKSDIDKESFLDEFLSIISISDANP